MVEEEVLYHGVRGGRRPFLVKRNSDSNNADSDEDTRDWWESKCDKVQSWLRSNPLNLGIETESVQLVRMMINKGEDKSEAVRIKCWAHICLELDGVPGNPTLNEEHIPSTKQEEINVKDALPDDHANQIDILDEEIQNISIDTSRSGHTEIHFVMERRHTEGGIPKRRAATPERRAATPERRAATPDLNSLSEIGSFIMSNTKSLSSMTLLERQQYCLTKKNIKAEKMRADLNDKEIEGCTYKPVYSSTVRRASYSSVESVIKRQLSTGSFGIAKEIEPSMELMERSTLNGLPPKKPQVKRVSRYIKMKKPDLLDECRSTLSNSMSNFHLNDSPNEDSSSNQQLNISTEIKDGDSAEPENEEENSPEIPDQSSEYISSTSDMDYLEPVVDDVSERKYSFANNSCDIRGKIPIADFNDFQLDSFYRKRDRGSTRAGVSLMMGVRESDYTEQIVAAIFDKSKFTEGEASSWLVRNYDRLTNRLV